MISFCNEHRLNFQGKPACTVSRRGKGETLLLTALLLLSTEYQVTLTSTSVQINSYPPYDSIVWEFITRRNDCTFNLDRYQYFDRFLCLRLYDPHRDSLKSHIFIPNFNFFLIQGSDLCSFYFISRRISKFLLCNVKHLISNLHVL